MSDPARPDPSHPEPGAALQAYKPYLVLFGIAAGGVALLVVVGGIALAIFMNAGWVLVPLACAIWTLFPLRDLRELEDGTGFFEGASPDGGGSGPPVTGPGATDGRNMARRRAAWYVVRQRAMNALLITFAAWAALILLHLI